MNRITCFFLLHFFSICAQGQNITVQDAGSFRKSLGIVKTDTGRINLILKLAEYQIMKPGEFKADLDSGRSYIDQAISINAKSPTAIGTGKILLAESYIARDKGQIPLAKSLAEKAVSTLATTTDQYDLGQAYYNLSYYFAVDIPAEQTRRVQLFTLGIAAFKSINAIEREAFGYQNLGDVAIYTPDCLAQLKKSLSLYNSIHYQRLQGIYDLLGITYFNNKDLPKALEYLLLALKTAEKFHDNTMQLCEINNHIGLVYYETDRAAAIPYFAKSLEIAKACPDKNAIYLVGGNLINCYINLKRYPEAQKTLAALAKEFPIRSDDTRTLQWFLTTAINIELKLNRFNLALPYVLRLNSLVQDPKTDHYTLKYAYVTLASYYFKTGKHEKAGHLLKKLEEIKKTMSLNEEQNMYRIWFGVDSAQHQYKAAIGHLLTHNRLKDSLVTEKKELEFQKLQLQFETQKKVDQIKLLSQREKLQQANLSRTEMVKNITIGGIILVLIIAGLLYRQGLARKKNNSVVTRKNGELQHLVTEKEWLLKEVHHRVKNNLHTVICLLESQARYLHNDALKAIENSQHRIFAMSLIHQKLYQSDDIKNIKMSTYVPELVQYLEDSFDSSDRVHFELNVACIQLNISHAIPIGLIINEAVTNSIKYAFPDQRHGIISITMDQENQRVKLILADNGIGIPEDICATGSDSLGLTLMKGLSEDIKADISYEKSGGTKIILEFDLDALNTPDSIFCGYKTS